VPTPTVFRGALSIREPLAGSVVTCGTFDGVHRAHQALVSQAVARAKELGATPVAYTFDPHPAKLLAPARAPMLLESVEERVRHLGELGIEVVVVEPFDAAFAAVSADEWVERYLVAKLAPKHLVIGANFSYGKARGGDPSHLRHAGERFGFGLDVVSLVRFDGEVVSSSRVRALLQAGEVEAAARLLGRPFAITGLVVEGDRRGRTIGFPTANLSPDAELVPVAGVYASRAELDDGRIIDAVTNIGMRPTFKGLDRRIEAHLLDFEGDLYGRRMRLGLIARLRDEQKFEGIEALTAQIRKDVLAARERLGGER
jgi:riboflavin kinase / FMN adenylyltransferase